MKTGYKLKSAAVSAALATLLAACGGVSGSTIALENPEYFSGRVSEGTMGGAYNPAGYSAAQVRKLVTDACQSGGLNGFSTQAREDGLTGFAATCGTWKGGAGLVSFQRADEGGIVIQITGSDGSGNVTYQRIDSTL